MHEDIGEILNNIREDRRQIGKMLKQRDRDARLNDLMAHALDLGHKIGYTQKAAEISGSYRFAEQVKEIYESLKEQLL